MPNADLKGKKYNIPEPVVSKVSSALSKYQNGGDTKGYKKLLDVLLNTNF